MSLIAIRNLLLVLTFACQGVLAQPCTPVQGRTATGEVTGRVAQASTDSIIVRPKGPYPYTFQCSKAGLCDTVRVGEMVRVHYRRLFECTNGEYIADTVTVTEAVAPSAARESMILGRWYPVGDMPRALAAAYELLPGGKLRVAPLAGYPPFDGKWAMTPAMITLGGNAFVLVRLSPQEMVIRADGGDEFTYTRTYRPRARFR